MTSASPAFFTVPRLLEAGYLNTLAERLTRAACALDQQRLCSPSESGQLAIAPRGRFVVSASSFGLDAVLSDRDIMSLFELVSSKLASMGTELFAGTSACLNVEHSWFRRQYPPDQAPPGHWPHSWHQDGALGFDFLAQGDDAAHERGLLEMMTCWIALNPCGQDAPGLEFINDSPRRVLSVDELSDHGLRRHYGPGEFCRPILDPGDALLFGGATPHRTHVTPAMNQNRASLELRFFPAARLPSRLAANRYVRKVQAHGDDRCLHNTALDPLGA